MWIHYLVSLPNAVLAVAFGAFVYWKNRKRLVGKVYSLISFCGALWSIANFAADVSGEIYTATLWSKAAIIGPAFIPPVFLLFSQVFPDKKHLSGKRYWLYFVPSIIILLLSPTSLNVSSVVLHDWGAEVTPGPLYILLLVLYLVLMGWATVNFARKLKVSTALVRTQIKYVLYGISLGSAFGILTNLLLLLINESRLSALGPLAVTIMVALSSYAIIRYRLMDTRLVLSLGLLYAALVVVISFAFTFVTFISSQVVGRLLGQGSTFIITLIASTIFAVGYDPLRRFLGKITDRIFFSGQVDVDAVIDRLAKVVATELSFYKLIEQVEGALVSDLKIRGAAVLVNSDGNFIRKREGIAITVEAGSVLANYLMETRRILVTEDLKQERANSEDKAISQKLEAIEAQLESLGAAVVVPIIGGPRGDEFQGMIIILEKVSRNLFTLRELRLFSVLGPQLAAALQKSQLYSEVQDYSANLQKKVESATARLQEVNGLLATRNDRLNTLQKFANVILQSYRLEEMSQRIIDYIPGEIPGCDMAVLVMVDEQKRELYGRSISQPYAIARQIIRLLGNDLTKYRVPLSNRDNLLTKVVSEKKMQKTADLYDFLRPGIAKPLVWALQNVAGAMREAVAVPLTVRGQVTGILIFVFGMKRPPLTDEDYLLLQAVADQVGIALERTRVYDELEKLNDRLNEANHYLQQLDKAKSEFLSIASHQLRTPTTGIKGFLSMMLEGDYGQVTKEQREVLQTVYDSTNRLIRLVNVFLNVSRIESGRLQLARAEVDLAQLAKVVVTELRPAAKARGLTLELQAPEHVATVPADSDKIRDVLVNLADNAIKYTEHGSVTVRVAAHPAEVEVAVSDTGMGLSADEIKALFAKFSRGERVKIKESQGSGLGLFIAKKIIEAHAGKIWVTSPGPGKGTTFYFTLPTKPPKDADAGLSTLPTDTGSKPVGK